MFSNNDNLYVMENDTQEIFVEGIKKLFVDANRERQRLRKDKLTWAEIAIELGTTPGNLSSFLTLKRNYSEPKQKALANFFGKTYLEVFDLGRQLLSNTTTMSPQQASMIDIQEEATKKHQLVIEGFQDKERALKLNQLLVEIEKRAPDKLLKIEGYLEGILQELPNVNTAKKTGTNQLLK